MRPDPAHLSTPVRVTAAVVTLLLCHLASAQEQQITTPAVPPLPTASRAATLGLPRAQDEKCPPLPASTDQKPQSSAPAVPASQENDPLLSSTGTDTVAAPDDSQAATPTIKLRGRIQPETVIVSQSEKNQAIIGPLQDATGFRRARLGAEGTVGDQVNWVAEFDFAGGVISFRDVYVGVNELPVIDRVRVGHFIEPLSLEGMTSSNYFSFVERSPAYALEPARNWGVGIYSYTENERATLDVAAFRSGTSNSTGDAIGNGNQNGLRFPLHLPAMV